MSADALIILAPLATLALTLVAIWAALRGVDWLHKRSAQPHDEHRHLRAQLLKALVVGLGAVIVLLELPLSETTRGQLFSLLGLVLSAILALASTTFVANIMAGIMLRSVGNFRPGDFVRVGEHFGRVSERGLFHTELQTEDRDLTTLPNLYLVTNPVSVVHATGTIVSAQVSLGYDVNHQTARHQLLEAARQAELQEPFVRVTELLDHAVAYRVAGFLAEPKTMLQARSRLRESILDTLHTAGIEIASPGLLGLRRLAPEGLLPAVVAAPSAPPEPAADAMAFDKAERAESIEELKARREALAARLGEEQLDPEESKRRLAQIDAQIEDHKSEAEAGTPLKDGNGAG